MLFRDRTLISLDQVDSTNNYAANLIKLSTPPDGTVITASKQTEGKGQRGAVWESEKGENLLFSILTYPVFLSTSQRYYLSKIVSLAVADALENFLQKEIFIKWPNDIIVSEKKIAGLLLELNWLENRIQSAIFGIGINVNQKKFNQPTATSIWLISGKEWNLSDGLQAVLRLFDRYYLQLQCKFFSEIDKAYRARLFRLNQVSDFIYHGQPIKASIIGVDEAGLLMIETKKNELLKCDLKEISLVY